MREAPVSSALLPLQSCILLYQPPSFLGSQLTIVNQNMAALFVSTTFCFTFCSFPCRWVVAMAYFKIKNQSKASFLSPLYSPHSLVSFITFLPGKAAQRNIVAKWQTMYMADTSHWQLNRAYKIIIVIIPYLHF